MTQLSDLLSKIIPLAFPVFSAIIFLVMWLKNRALRQSEIDILKLKQTAESASLDEKIKAAEEAKKKAKDAYEKSLNNLPPADNDKP